MNEQQDIDEHLEQLTAKKGELGDKCLYQSEIRLAEEIRRIAKAEKRLLPYLHATFTIMNHASNLLEPVRVRERSIELIGLLESEERARTFQPDLPQAEYESTANWWLSCGYDNLAKATGWIKGFNSDGMHTCISEGIEVCRRTGKHQCITCFREYAIEVYTAADDLAMVQHYIQVGIKHQDPGPHDRRWISVKHLADVSFNAGQFQRAAEIIEQSWEMCETWHSPFAARLQVAREMRKLALMLGQPDRWSAQRSSVEPPSKDEFPEYAWLSERLDALEASIGGNHQQAIEILTRWDTKLTQCQFLDNWFENRLQLLATHRFAGNDRQFERLAEQLKLSAETARDWMTLRQLEILTNQFESIRCPLPLLNPADSGPYSKAGHQSQVALDLDHQPVKSAKQESDSTAEPLKDDETKEENREPPEFLVSFMDRFRQLHFGDETTVEDSQEKILSDYLSVSPIQSDPLTAAWMLHFLFYLQGEDRFARQVWDWATAVYQQHQQHPGVMSLYARLGNALRNSDAEGLAELINQDSLESLFRNSLQLDANSAMNHCRAGEFFAMIDNLGEAERCFARGFRIDRTNSELVTNLARVYRMTERDRDALAVLDMAIRECCDDPTVLWQAALTACQLEQHQIALTYLDSYSENVHKQPWVEFYRAGCLLELDRSAEALDAAQREASLNPDAAFPALVQQTTAYYLLGNEAQFNESLESVLASKLFEADSLNVLGLTRLFRTLWKAVGQLPQTDDRHQRFLNYVVSANLASDEMFTPYRSQEEFDDVNYYACTFEQPVDKSWKDFSSRLAEEESLTSYQTRWGVLARDEEEATALAGQWQKRCYHLPAKLVDVTMLNEGYRASVGILWQSYRDQ